jgi:transcriptional regulator with XRE-family HTH domain
MKNFGETLRELRVAQNIGLREMAVRVDISPAYLSRIERGKERPPRPELIKSFARLLAADPDVLFRLSSSTDPEVVDFLRDQPEAMNLLRFVKREGFSSEEWESLLKAAEEIKGKSASNSEPDAEAPETENSKEVKRT